MKSSDDLAYRFIGFRILPFPGFIRIYSTMNNILRVVHCERPHNLAAKILLLVTAFAHVSIL